MCFQVLGSQCSRGANKCRYIGNISQKDRLKGMKLCNTKCILKINANTVVSTRLASFYSSPAHIFLSYTPTIEESRVWGERVIIYSYLRYFKTFKSLIIYWEPKICGHVMQADRHTLRKKRKERKDQVFTEGDAFILHLM